MKKIIFFIPLVLLVLSTNTTAAAVKIPYEFKSGEPAKAAEVNANFKALQDAIEQLQKLVTKLEAQNSSLATENRTLKTTIADLQTQIDNLAKQVAALEKQGVAAVTPTPIPAANGPRLRSKPVTVSENAAKQQFNVDNSWQPRTYIENDFEVQGETVIDHATGLTWQKSGSPDSMTYQEAQAYIGKLNQKRFAGYSDWRLPTVDELLSLVEQDKQPNDLYINPIFDRMQKYCWSVDKTSSGAAWYVDFYSGRVYWYDLDGSHYVRAVRS